MALWKKKHADHGGNLEVEPLLNWQSVKLSKKQLADVHVVLLHCSRSSRK